MQDLVVTVIQVKSSQSKQIEFVVLYDFTFYKKNKLNVLVNFMLFMGYRDLTLI